MLRRSLFGVTPGVPVIEASVSNDGLVKANPILGLNLARYAIRRRLRSLNSNALAYQIASESPGDSQLMKILLGDAWTLRYSVKDDPEQGLSIGWYADVGGAKIMLPTADEVWRGTLARQPGFVGLLETRYRIGMELGGYAFVTGGDAGSVQSLRRILARGFRFD